MRVNYSQLALKILLALSEVEQIAAGEEQDLDPIMIESGTTLVTVNINVKQDKPK